MLPPRTPRSRAPLHTLTLAGLAVLAAHCSPPVQPADVPSTDASDITNPTDGPAPDGPRDASPIPDASHLPATFTLMGEGITVDVTRAPYSYRVRNAAGETVLETRGDGTGDGYGSVGWTSGRVRWSTSILAGGYFTFDPTLDPWRDDWVVIEANQMGTRLELVLRPRDGAGSERLVIAHILRNHTLRIEARLDGAAVPPRGWTASFAAPANEGYLGFGERFNRTNQRGVNVYNWAEEGGIGHGEGTMTGPTNPGPNGEAMAYYPVPYFISTRGYGFWLDTTYRSEFNLATQRQDAWRVWSIGPSLAYEVYLPNATDTRPFPYQLVDRFTETVGRPMLPPAWTFGPRRRISRTYMVDGVLEIQAMRDRDLAITATDDSVHFLPAGSHVGVESELRAWTAENRRLGYMPNCYYNSLISVAEDSPIRAEFLRGQSNNWLLRNTRGELSTVFLISGMPVTVAQVDFTSREATTWFQSMLGWGVDHGYYGWMYDFGEYVQPDAVASNNMTGEELHNLYPVLYQRAVHEAMEAPTSPVRGNWLAFARSGYTGAWQYTPMVWSGDPAASFEDSDGLPSVVRGLINLSASGAPHSGSDIGGFHCVADGYALADGEMLTRWIQFGSMSPNMMDQNSCSGARDMGTKASIWNAPTAQAAWRTYARLHTRLFPYFYTLAHQANRTGSPQARSLFFEHPDRPEYAAIDDEFYLGPALLVAPVVRRNARTRDVRFPPGRFLDWREGRLIEGDRMVSVDAPLDKLPLYLRDGHIIPMLDPRIDTLAEETNPDVIGPTDVANVYDVVGFLSRGRTATFTLYDGGTLSAAYTDTFAPPAGFTEAASEGELATCTRCYLRTQLPGEPARVRINAPAAVNAGGLALSANTGRSTRWDLYLAD